MRVLVLGGAGFLGRHVAAALAARGHARRSARARAATGLALAACVDALRGPLDAPTPGRPCSTAWTRSSTASASCASAVRDLRPRAPSRPGRARAGVRARADCASSTSPRWVSTTQRAAASSRRSSTARRPIRASGADYTIVRPSLLDGEGGFGARWLRALARLPLCIACRRMPPAASRCWTSNDAGHAIARLVRACPAASIAKSSLGGHRPADARGAPRRAARRSAPAPSCCASRRLLARIASHVCDVAALLAVLLRASRALAARQRAASEPAAGVARCAPARGSAIPESSRLPRAAASARDRASPPPIAVRDGGSTPSARVP